ncbi:MAG: efflux RND transporter periplasmic adaptor subunit [Acidobacteriota bacterium]
MKKKVAIGIAALVVIAGAILGWTMLKNNKNGVVKFRTDKITKGDIEALVITSGTLNPITLVEVGSEVSGKIAKLYVDFNSQVKEGQILAELDQSILQSKVDQNQANYLSSLASLEKAKVTLENLQKKNERASTLFEKNLISYEEKEAAEANFLGAKTDLQSAEARVEQSKSQLESSKVDLSHSIIRSPIEGVVISRNMNMGQTVQASFSAPKLFEIANDLSKMQVECSVDEADIGKVKEGQKVRFTVDAFPEESFNGGVKQVRYAATVTQNVVTYTTIVEVDNPGLKLRPGMTATVSIVTGEAKGVLRVPNAALRFTPNVPAEELAKIMKEAGERMFAKRQAEGQGAQPGAGQTQSKQAAQGGQRAMTSPAGGSMFQGFGGATGPGGAQRRKPTTIWYLDENGKLTVTFIRAGVTDNSFTEILRSELKEGQEVILGEQTQTAAASTSAGGPPPMMMIRR